MGCLDELFDSFNYGYKIQHLFDFTSNIQYNFNELLTSPHGTSMKPSSRNVVHPLKEMELSLLIPET